MSVDDMFRDDDMCQDYYIYQDDHVCQHDDVCQEDDVCCNNMYDMTMCDTCNSPTVYTSFTSNNIKINPIQVDPP